MPRGRATGTLQGSGVRVVRPTGWCRGQEDGPKGVTRKLDWHPPGAWEDGSPFHAPGLGSPAKRVPQTVPGGAVCGVSCMKAGHRTCGRRLWKRRRRYLYYCEAAIGECSNEEERPPEQERGRPKRCRNPTRF
jgi:hypothetical protein